MSKGIVRIYYGEGHGKSTAALGTAIREVSHGKTATVISFLKEKNADSEELLKKLEPELKFFRFEKTESSFDELSTSEKEEEIMNLKNGYNYSKKVISTGGCDLVVLDEVLGLLEKQIVTEEEFLNLVAAVPEDMVVICTGRTVADSVRECADELYQITLEK
ncbi:MAG: cob(I)yrinic acid a,c-diamide adenosyltransferase [Agathobacter sp.]|nr:cob(I)yrinic acid a,c-diamide adenosyltransferase [Agathobacter sp.]